MLMLKSKNARVASLSFVNKLVKILVGPISLLVISNKMSSQELAFYYAFFSLISMQQMIELGIGHVLKQYISHSFYEIDGFWASDSKAEVKRYFYFSIFWFFGVSLFLIFIVGYAGELYLNVGDGPKNWRSAWWLLIFTSSISNLVLPLTILLDGVQKQESIFRSQVLSGLLGAIVLWISVSLGLGLYSIAISLMVSTLFSMFILLSSGHSLIIDLIKIKEKCDFFSTLRVLWPLLRNVSIVWGLGVVFWNSFNLISFRYFPSDMAGLVIFGMVLAKSGFNISESLTQGQMTIFSNLISRGDIDLAKSQFDKYCFLSMSLIVIGYLLFAFIWFLFPGFYIFNKIPDLWMMSQLFIYFSILLYKTLQNNFVRCFKIEPFVRTAVVESIFNPLLFLLGVKYLNDNAFIPCIAFMSVMTYLSLSIGKTEMRKIDC